MLSLADYFLLGSVIPAALFWLTFGVGSPWYRSLFGWVIFLYASAVVAILSLVVFSVFAGSTAPEAVRTIVYAFLFCALWAKFVILLVERRNGRRFRNANPNRKD